NIQLAKSAIYAGIITLIDNVNIKIEKVDSLILAGGFGSSFNINSAIKIGLIPKALKNKTLVAGNSALRGSRLLLFDSKLRNFAKEIGTNASSVTLSTNTKFFEEYINGMAF
ncbi:MAG TPA: ASKHA domain-containing protein, partial [Oscillospiraceae bacterium]|nr:ASKHA domain-containing protein [Oscillospiraceae bacterium]